ncbi:MAG TPA: hypothetical protein VLG48_09415 [Candidatus Methylomirabilis sp.]|nr:hypothetical protein [Candidatus Methylomirabilis sp.]
MSDTPPAVAPDEELAAFQVDCPTCGRTSDAPETSFLAGPLAPVLDTSFLLCRLKCEGCGTGFDRVFWPVQLQLGGAVASVAFLGIVSGPDC